MYKILYRSSRLEQSFKPQVADWVSVALGALGAATSILGGLSSANAAKRAEKLRQEQDAKNAAWFNKRYNESFIDTSAGRNAIRQAIDYGKRQTQRAEGAAAVTGGTDAAVAQAKEGANRMVGDTIGQLAAQDTARKEQAVETYLGQQERSTAQQMANEKAKAAGIAQAAQGASNAMMTGASLLNNVGSSGGNAANSRPSSIPESAIAPTQAEQNAINTAFANKAAENLNQVNTDYAAKHGLTLDEVTRPSVKDGLVQRWRK